MVSVLLYTTSRREGTHTSLDTCVELKSNFQSAMCSLHVDHAYGFLPLIPCVHQYVDVGVDKYTISQHNLKCDLCDVHLVNFACLHNCLLTNTRTVITKMKREYFILNLKMMPEASKRRCNKIKLLSLSLSQS